MNLISRIEPTLDGLEEEYRQHFLKGDVGFASIALFLTSLAVIAMVGNDYLFFGKSEQFWLLVICRAVFVISVTALIFVLPRLEKASTCDQAVLITLLVCSACLTYVNFTRAPLFQMMFVWNMLAIVGIYIIFPNYLPSRAAPAVLLSVAIIVMAVFSRHLHPSQWLNAVILSVLAANVVGVVFSLRWNRLRRSLFRAMIDSQQAEQRLRDSEEALSTSEGRFRRIYEEAPVMMHSIDKHGIVRNVNTKWLEEMGYSRDEVLGAQVREFMTPASSDVLCQVLPGFWREGKISALPYQYVKNDGTVIDVLLDSVVIEDPSLGEVSLSAVNNITDRKRAEEALRESEHLMRLIADNSPAYIAYVSTDDLHYQFVNQKFEPAFGMSREEIVGTHIRDVIGESNYQFAMKYIEEVKSGVPASYVNVFELEEGKRWVQVNYVPDFDEHGRVKGIVVFSYDVTETKSAEERLRESERRLSEIIDFLPDPTFAIDFSGRVIIWNKAIELITGIRAEDMLGKGDYEYAIPFYGERRPVLADLVLQRDKDFEQRYLEIRDQGERTLVSESYHPKLKADGAFIWATATPLYDSEGDVVGAIESLKDITSRVRTQEALSRSEERYKTLYKQAKETEELYQSLLESTLDSIVTYDMEGRVMFVNNAFTETFGWVKEELADGVPYTPESEREVTMRNVMQVTREGIPLKDFETKRYRKDGGLVDVGISASRFNDHEGNPAGMVVILRDISERKQAEKELAEALETAEQLRDEAQAANRTKSEFVANMSHEIRTPMNAIMGMTDLALRSEPEPKLRDYLTKIRTSSQSLLRIINDILDFSKIDAGKLDIESVPFDLRNVISNMSDVVSASDACRDIEFLVALDPDVPFGLIGDPLRLEQVLTNLASNAVKFTPSGEVVVKVERVEAPGDKANLQFSVSDTGIGIAEDMMATLFHPFTQADGSTTRRFGGSGLGLTICRRLINMMGGDIHVESEPGKGSVFSFQLEFESKLGEEKPLLSAPDDMRGMRVLVVDDNVTSQEILVEILRSFSFVSVAVGSGEEALEELIAAQNSNPYELILLDWKMPVLDGIETALRIDREKRLLGRIPKIIMVTAFGTEEIRSRAKEAGLDGFLSKPVQPSFLLDTIMDIFGKSGPRISKAAQARAREATGARNIRGARILIAEDNEINQQVAKEILEYAGATVEVAWNGKEAVEALNDAEFDAVLMDIQMPEMDGFEATRAIRSDERFKDLPIIAMTAHAMTGDREKSLQEGMNDHISKPINSADVIGTIVKWLPDRSEDSCEPQPSLGKEPRDAHGELPESLPGIDLAGTVRRLEGNKSLMWNLLVGFGRRYVREPEKIRDAWNQGDSTTARRLCHTLRGVAANIGADDLSHIAGRLEKRVEDCSEDEFSEMVKALEAELNKVTDSCSRIRDLNDSAHDRNAGEVQESAGPLDHATIQPLVRELDEMLDRRNSRARRIVKELVEAVGSAHCSETVNLLQNEVSALDFENASVTLQRMAEELGISMGDKPNNGKT